MKELLVVAGEGSGDAWAARVVERLGAPAFGMGGARLAAAGTELVGDLRDAGAMGLVAVVGRALPLAHAVGSVVHAARRRAPRAALLVGFSEVNARLSPWLRARGTRVLWYAPPQVWAWRRGRVRTLSRRADRFAVVLPFEERLWREASATAEYVGHPALELRPADAHEGPARLPLLPGSRAHEVRAHLSTLLDASGAVARRVPGLPAHVVLAPSLDRRTAAWARDRARARGVSVTEEPLERALEGAPVALAASGTATLECAVLGVPPVIVYRTDPITYAVARRLVRVPFVGLPNLVLGREAFPELVQGAFTGERAAEAVLATLERRDALLGACREVRAALRAGLDDGSPSERVARRLSEWLA